MADVKMEYMVRILSLICGGEDDARKAQDLYKRRSGCDPGMSARRLRHAGHLFERFLTDNELKEYGDRLLQLPVPRPVVLYTGRCKNGDTRRMGRYADGLRDKVTAWIEITRDVRNEKTKPNPPPDREDLKTHYLRGDQNENERKKRCRCFKRR